MSYTDATDQVLAVLDGAGIQAWRDDAQYEALANAIRHAIAMHIRPTIAAKDAEIARLREALALTASYPLEQFGIGDDHTDLQPLFGANNWQITVGDVRKARAALAPVEVGK